LKKIYHDTSDGQKLINYYNIKTYPLVAVIDPRTGEKIVQWSKLDSTLFCELVTNFLSDHELPETKIDDENIKIVNVDGDDDEITNDNNNTDKKISGFGSPKLPNIKYLSFTDRVEATKNSNLSPIKKKLNSKQATEEIIKPNQPKTLITTNSIVISDSSSSSSDEDCRIKNVKITTNGKKNLIKKENKDEPVAPTPPPPSSTSSSNIPKQIRYETQTNKKDCHLRIMIPSGDRIDFITDGDAKIKVFFFFL
jgi:hypothetical protein